MMNELMDFENCLAQGNDYTKHLSPLLDGQGALSVKGPMSREEAISFFYRCRLNTFPLYMLEQKGGIYAFY